MAQAITQIEVPMIPLSAASADDYCASVLATRGAEAWWWQTGLAPYRGYSRPFRDRLGRWWWRIKPQFSWALDFFSPITDRPRLPLGKSILGCQYPAPPECANSLAHFNVVGDMAGYDLGRVASQKRRAIRKGVGRLDIAPLDVRDDEQVEEARAVWNSHVDRTGWNRPFDRRVFCDRFRPLADMGGTNVLAARDSASGELCAWVIGRLVAGIAFVDTIASHTERLMHRPNDTLIFVLLVNASRTPGVRHANYFLRSGLEPLERFKRSLGFDSSGIPSIVRVSPLVGLPMRVGRPATWARLHGDWPRRPQEVAR